MQSHTIYEKFIAPLLKIKEYDTIAHGISPINITYETLGRTMESFPINKYSEAYTEASIFLRCRSYEMRSRSYEIRSASRNNDIVS